MMFDEADVKAWLEILEVERSDVRDDEADERRELEVAGWRPQERAGKIVWQNPESGYWYPQGVAIAMLREAAEPGDIPKEPEGGA